MLSSTIGYVLRYTNFTNWNCFGLAVFLIIISVFVCLLTYKYRAGLTISLLINAIALGFLIRTWYIFRNFDNDLWLMLLIALICIVYLWLFYLLLSIPLFEKFIGWFLLAFVILSLIAYAILVASTTTTFLSTLGFYMIVQIAFIVGLCLEAKNSHEILKHLLFSSYSIIIIAIIIGLAMLGGDGFDLSFDGFGGDGGSLRSPRKKQVGSTTKPLIK